MNADEPTSFEKLDKYRLRALDLGATDARLISTRQILLDERARAKCRVPTCSGWNTNANCPPYTMAVQDFRTVVESYSCAVFFKVDVTSGGFQEFERVNKKVVSDITWRLESAAFYDGYHFAMGFGGTGCKGIFCPDVECSALKGVGCRFPWRARPAMHGAGFDVYGMARLVGWDLIPVGPSTNPETVSHMSSLGIVLIT